MSVQFEDATATSRPQKAGHEGDLKGWDLDVSIVESGPSADRLIRMTDDGCGQTCESACSATCP
ncbi:FxLD family lanthipeptide [Streptomyces sp. GS7]|uniref:FxLD family lanthipeptide n=1 Tax=Streptomyces sp. GS7 TaxID=2692234 RepID=UPI0013178D87|nr:FxLD family lanthipeptide [Streptomyces sp. GS7]QHC26378.1 FxLD family lantipeptide [Streptomyces sp. GS7]